MIEQDTVKLLRECDAGVKMGVESIAEVLDDVRSDALRRLLAECKREHDVLSRRFCLRFHGRHYICNVCDILLCCTCPRETNLKTGGTQVCVGIPFGSFCASCVDSAAEAEKHKKSNVIIAVLLCAGPLFFRNAPRPSRIDCADIFVSKEELLWITFGSMCWIRWSCICSSRGS